MKVFVGRSRTGWYILSDKNTWSAVGIGKTAYYEFKKRIDSFCPKFFQKYTGIKLKIGECAEVEMTFKIQSKTEKPAAMRKIAMNKER